jgi:hypothetical protein
VFFRCFLQEQPVIRGNYSNGIHLTGKGKVKILLLPKWNARKATIFWFFFQQLYGYNFAAACLNTGSCHSSSTGFSVQLLCRNIFKQAVKRFVLPFPLPVTQGMRLFKNLIQDIYCAD